MRLVIKKTTILNQSNVVARKTWSCVSAETSAQQVYIFTELSTQFRVYSVWTPRHPNTFYQYRLTINLCENFSFVSPNRSCDESRIIRSRKERPKCVTTWPEFFLVYQVSLNNNLYRSVWNVEIVLVLLFYMMDFKTINIIWF